MSNLIVLFLSLTFFLYGCTDNSSPISENSNHKKHTKIKKQTFYTCSMHPQVREKKPGRCPICHMNLTKIEVDDNEEDDNITTQSEVSKSIWHCKDFPDVTSAKEETCPLDGTPMTKMVQKNKAAKVIAMVKLRKAQLQHFTPDFFPVTKMKMTKNIRLLGSVLQSEEKESSIPARIAGRIEKVYVKSTGSFIRIGEPVVDLYSPKLITAGEEYLLAKQSYLKNKTREFKDMLKQSEERLRLWGIRQFQFERWFKNQKIPRKITIYSSATGIVRKKNATVGKYFKEGQNFFELSDLADVWIEMDVYEHDAALVKLAQKVDLKFTSLPGEIVQGEIDFISPILDERSRTLKVRTTIKNTSGKLKPGMVANATLNIEIEGHPLVIPRSAIIDTGKRKVVWIKISNKKFQARIIHTGYESEGYVEIKHGLIEKEEVVIEGNFLLDAQAQLFGGYEDMKSNGTAGHNH